MSMSLWCEEGGQGQQESQLRAPWDPSLSGQRVINMLLRTEVRYLPSPLYISLVQREPHRREELTKWILEVCCGCACEETVFPLAVSLLDRFLSVSLSMPVSPFCLSATCVLIASKLMESETVSADGLCAAAGFSFLPKNLREMERVVLATLRWDVATITPQDFIPHLLPSHGEKKDGNSNTEDVISTLRRHSDTLIALCVCDSRFLGTPPSLVAAAALNSALRGLGNRGTQLGNMSTTLAALCQADLAVLQYYTDLIEGALQERLRSGVREGDTDRERKEEDGETEDERASTPTDLREIDF